MRALLIGIDPPDKFKDKIINLKNRVTELAGFQEQCNEPPHLTFVVNNFDNLKTIDLLLKVIANDFNKFQVQAEGINHFPSNKSGSFILHVAFQKDINLTKLQKRIVIETAQYRQGSLLQNYLSNNLPRYIYSVREIANIKQYGYPYMGSNWVPHMTIAILDAVSFKKIRKEISRIKIRGKVTLDNLTLFLYKHSWRPYRRYPLAP